MNSERSARGPPPGFGGGRGSGSQDARGNVPTSFAEAPRLAPGGGRAPPPGFGGGRGSAGGPGRGPGGPPASGPPAAAAATPVGPDTGRVVSVKGTFVFVASDSRPHLRGIYLALHELRGGEGPLGTGDDVAFTLVTNGGDPSDDRSFRAVAATVTRRAPPGAQPPRQPLGPPTAKARQGNGGPGGQGGGRVGGNSGGGGGRGNGAKSDKHVSEREEGTVKALKDGFGFVACATEPKYGDLFFAFEDVGGDARPPRKGAPPQLAIGQRCAFAVDLNWKTGEYRASKLKPCAEPAAEPLRPGMDGLITSFKPAWMSSSSSSASLSAADAGSGAAAATAPADASRVSLKPGGGMGMGMGAMSLGMGAGMSLKPGGGSSNSLAGADGGSPLKPGGAFGGGWGAGAAGGGAGAAPAASRGKPSLVHSLAAAAPGAAAQSRADLEAALFGCQIAASDKAALFGDAAAAATAAKERERERAAASGRGGGEDGGGRGRGRGRGSGGGGGSGRDEPRAPLASTRETGTVKALKDFFGFISCTSEPRYGDIFFHADEIQGTADLPLGAHVEFAVEANKNRAGEYRALRVKLFGAPDAPLRGATSARGGAVAAGADGGAAPAPPKAKARGEAGFAGNVAPEFLAKPEGKKGGEAKAEAAKSAAESSKAGDGKNKSGKGGAATPAVPPPPPASASAPPARESREAAYTPFGDKRTLLGWLAKRQSEPAAGLLLKLSNFMRPLEDICERTELPAEAVGGVLALLAAPGVRRSVMREKGDALYLRVLRSALARDASNLEAYLRALPAAPGGPSARTAAFADVVAVLGEWLARAPPAEGAALPWPALRDAARATALPVTLEEELGALLHAAQKAAQNCSPSAATAAAAPAAAAWAAAGSPSDFRNVPIFPDAAEILSGEPPVLRPNIVDGHYENALEYLETHFRLLREDCLAPLRSGVRAYLAGEATADVRVYPRCQLVGLHCGREGVAYRVAFRLPRGTRVAWERSKRLMYGSLALLSADGFKTLLWATVANRDAALCGATGGLVDLRFPAGLEERFAPGVSYTLVESAATYFEAYQHVLRALQAVGADPAALPFAEQLLRCRAAVAPPAYLRRPGADRYAMSEVFPSLEADLGRPALHVLQDWPPPPGQPGAAASALDASQLAAVKLALTREVALIQGPPGTGKTFVGLKVVHTLLQNYRARPGGGPILVVTMTNHALDQFLEGILAFESSLIRVGSRSRSEVLAGCNLRDAAFEAGRADPASGHARKGVLNRMRDLEKFIAGLVADINATELTVEDIEAVADWEQMASLRSGGGMPGAAFLPDDAKLKIWLQPATAAAAAAHAAADAAVAAAAGEGDAEPAPPPPPKVRGGAFGRARPAQPRAPPPAECKVDEEGASEDEEEALEVDRDGHVVNRAVRERMFDDDTPGGGGGGGATLSFGAGVDDDDGDDDGEEEDGVDVATAEDVWALAPRARARLYASWKAAATSDASAELASACARYERLVRERRELDEANQLRALQSAAVVGMTTTGVAKYQRLIAALEAEVVVVEEAAEVLEAHLVATLTRATRHLILIGDHLQLRPGTAVYALAKRYNLDVSLFERLVRNGVEHCTLARQRRMAPPIARLLAPVYPALHDHPDVSRYPAPLGVAQPLFFVTHSEAETFDGETRSRSNEFEAGYIHALAVHLLRSGVPPARITVLATYCGQLFALRRRFRAPGSDAGLDEVRLCSVDQYQGEENDYILLSLVRSNPRGDIGFLSVQNRMVVALSRARHAMYIVGNARLLAGRSPLWAGVVKALEAEGRLGPALPCLAGKAGAGGARKTVAVASAAEFCACAPYA
jgi:cold shock CspA family protein